MKKISNKLIYFLFRCGTALFSLMSFRLLYAFSDGVCFLLYKGIGYRKKVVMENLRNSFPEKGEAELQQIAQRFYHHLADVFLESLKTFSVSAESFGNRFVIVNPEVADRFYDADRQIIIVLGHYNNWEWPAIVAERLMKHKPVGFYKPMTNVYVDRFVKEKRGSGRTVLASIKDTVQVFKTKWGEPALFYMIADQSPSNVKRAYWMKFLNQDTAVLHGPEKYAIKYDLPVIYGKITKVKRGYYSAELFLISDHSPETGPGEITEKFMKILEDQIREKPEHYLWSHRRWKHKRPTP